MSRNYDNWDRLVTAVLRRDQIWKLCHQQSTISSLRSSISSDFNSSFRSNLDNEFPKDAHLLPFQTVAGVRKAVRFVHFENSPFAFDLEELLAAPSFVLGDEIKTFDNTYAVRLNDDVTVVAKRWGRGVCTYEMEQRLQVIQFIQHENVVGLRGYLFTKQGTSFGFYDHFHQGSLHSILHGQKLENRVHLDWEARLRVAVGAAKGLLHIHRQEGGNFIHGSIKASNVFLNSQGYGCIDIKPGFEISSRNRLYHSPEFYRTMELSQAGDVYSFGVVLIELVSGRSPWHYSVRHKSFGDWALHNARDESGIMFDREILKDCLVKRCSMWDMVGVALSCLREKPKERPNMEDVVERLELVIL